MEIIIILKGKKFYFKFLFYFYLFFSFKKCILEFYKILNIEFNRNKEYNYCDIFKNLSDALINNWDKDVVRKGQELTKFYNI